MYLLLFFFLFNRKFCQIKIIKLRSNIQLKKYTKSESSLKKNYKHTHHFHPVNIIKKETLRVII